MTRLTWSKGFPLGVRIRIGWTVTGRLPGHIQECESVCKDHVATPDEQLNGKLGGEQRTLVVVMTTILSAQLKMKES